MDINQEIASRAPTLKSSRAIWFLLLVTPAVCALVSFLNPIMLELDSKYLTWLQIGIIILMIFCTSLYLNYHFYKWHKLVAAFHSEISTLVTKAIIDGAQEITKKLLTAKSKEEIIYILKSYERKT